MKIKLQMTNRKTICNLYHNQLVNLINKRACKNNEEKTNNPVKTLGK